jgi:hypothetical protein
MEDIIRREIFGKTPPLFGNISYFKKISPHQGRHTELPFPERESFENIPPLFGGGLSSKETPLFLEKQSS